MHVPSGLLEVKHGLLDVLVVFFAATHLDIFSAKSANTYFQIVFKKLEVVCL